MGGTRGKGVGEVLMGTGGTKKNRIVGTGRAGKVTGRGKKKAGI